MKQLKNLWSIMYWAIYGLTPRGKKALLFRKSLEGFKESKKEELQTKFKVVGYANKLSKGKKILTFHRGKSISKPKKSNHQVIEGAKHKHSQELQERGLRITKRGKFKTV